MASALSGLAVAVLCLAAAFPSSRIVDAAAAGSISPSSSGDGAAGSSVLQALLESHYSEWMELVERAQMLQPLEQLVGSGAKLTIFAPQNHLLQPQIKAFVLKPSNAPLLREMVEFHVLPVRLTASAWPSTPYVASLAPNADPLSLRFLPPHPNARLFVGDAEITAPDDILRPDGVVHGVDQLLLPISIQQAYVAFSTRNQPTPLPTGAPAFRNEKQRGRAVLLEDEEESHEMALARFLEAERSSDESRISKLAASSPFLGPAPAPGPSLGPSASPRWYASVGEHEVETFVTKLQSFGGYQSFAGLLMDLTSLGSQLSRLVDEGYKLTVLAPDDKAWSTELTAEQLNEPSAIEEILHYHVITEYQTEESLYSTLRRNGKVAFSTLRVPMQLVAREVDGQVVFGEGEMAAGIFDPDIHADGRISVQGIDKVLRPAEGGGGGKKVADAVEVTRRKGRSVLEMLRLWTNSSGGLGRTVPTIISTVAATSFVLLVTVFLL